MRKLKKIIIFFLVMFVFAPTISGAKSWSNCNGFENDDELYAKDLEIVTDATDIADECKHITIIKNIAIKNNGEKWGCGSSTPESCGTIRSHKNMNDGDPTIISLKFPYAGRCCEEAYDTPKLFRWKGRKIESACQGTFSNLESAVENGAVGIATLEVDNYNKCWMYKCYSGYEKNPDGSGCTEITAALCKTRTKYLDGKECKACPTTGQEPNDAGTGCVCTDEKEYLDGGECKACGTGQVQNEAGTGCVCTDEKKYLDGGECKVCPAGKVQNAAGTGCGNKKIQEGDFTDCVNGAAAATVEAFKACLDGKAIVS
jgi:hypothetical protein